MAYKKLIKVSNVCQVLDKRTYPATGTKNGITFTNNGDGSYTANGTFSGSDGSYFYFTDNITLLANHKYLVLNGTYYEAGKYSVWLVVIPRLVAESNGTVLGNDYGARTYTPKNNEKNVTLSLRIKGNINTEIDNFVFKPQLFDLTEMYGAGHEPTSVEQFRQDFPEEMYDYSPYCWLNSYKRVFVTGVGDYLTSYQRNLTCKTKNLFDISKVTETNALKVKGNSIYSYNYPAGTNDTSTLSIFKSLKPNTNYTISAVCPFYLDRATNVISLAFNNGDSIWVFVNYRTGLGQNTFSLTQEQIDNIKTVYFYGEPEEKGGPIIWSNIQIEEGDTATDYVPYGHL